MSTTTDLATTAAEAIAAGTAQVLTGPAFRLSEEVKQAWTEATTAAGALAAAATVERTAKTSLVYTLAAAAITESKGAAEPIKVATIVGALKVAYPDAPAITGLDNVQTAAQRITSGAIEAQLDAGNYADTRAYLVAALTTTDADGSQRLASLKDLKAGKATDIAKAMPVALTSGDADAKGKAVAFIASGGKVANNSGQTGANRGAGQTAAEKEAGKPEQQQPSSVASLSTQEREEVQRARVIVATAQGLADAIKKLDTKGLKVFAGRISDPKHGMSPESFRTLTAELVAIEYAQRKEAGKLTPAEKAAETRAAKAAAKDAEVAA